MTYTAYPLSPLTPEKEKLLARACKEWNQLVYTASRIRRPGATPQKNRHLRRYILNQGKHTLHWRLARSAINKGLFGHYPYSPGKFFVPGNVLRVEQDVLWMRLFPRLELGFEWPRGLPYEIRVTKRKDGWYADF